MSIHAELKRYLQTIRKDAKDKRRIDNMINLIKRYEDLPIKENPSLSRQIGRFIVHLFNEMPEVQQADPMYIKLFPLYEYCDQMKPARKPRPNSGKF